MILSLAWKGNVRHESLLHPTSIALEVGDRVDGLWMAWEGFMGSHLLLEDIIAGLTLSLRGGETSSTLSNLNT